MLLGRQGRPCCWAAKGAGQPRAPGGRWPQDMLLGRQGHRAGFKGSRGRREGFKGSLVPNVAFSSLGKRSAGGQRTCCWASKGSARQVAKGLAAGPPRAPVHAAGPPKAPQSHFFSGALPLQMAGVGGFGGFQGFLDHDLSQCFDFGISSIANHFQPAWASGHILI